EGRGVKTERYDDSPSIYVPPLTLTLSHKGRGDQNTMSSAPQTTEYRKYLDPRTLARIASLDLRARLIVEGLMTGMHRSPYQGASVEFAQHRPYVFGDDIRHVDWKVLGKTDQIGRASCRERG